MSFSAESSPAPEKSTPSKKRREIHPSEEHLSKAELRERRILRTLMLRNRGPLIWYAALGLVNEVVVMAVPVLFGYVIDRGIMQADIAFTIFGALGVIAVRLIATWAWSTSFYGLMRIRIKEQHALRLALTAAALDPTSTPVDRPAGEVLSIATSDADRAPDIFDLIGWAFNASVAVVAAGIWLLWVNVWLGLTVFVGLALQVVALRYVTPILSQKYDAQRNKTADAAATATDLVHGLRVLQGLGVQSRAREVYKDRSRTALDAALVNARFSGLANGLMSVVSSVMIATVILIAGSLTLEGAMTVGTLIAVAGVVQSMSGMLDGLAGVPVWFASFSTAARRVRHLLSEMGRTVREPMMAEAARWDAPAPVVGSGRRLPGVGTIRTPILGPVHAPEVLAVVPATAADAAAVLAELAALELPRESLLLEPHAVDLFDGTLKEQLATGTPQAVNNPSPEWAYDALRAAGAEDLLEILPEGLEERIIDRGANLSGGQRQRLALARAVAADPPVLVLHDPTTAVDAVTEQKIALALTAARSGTDRLTVLVSKAPALLNEADRVVFVRAGSLALQGEHHELMDDPEYANVVQR